MHFPLCSQIVSENFTNWTSWKIFWPFSHVFRQPQNVQNEVGHLISQLQLRVYSESRMRISIKIVSRSRGFGSCCDFGNSLLFNDTWIHIWFNSRFLCTSLAWLLPLYEQQWRTMLSVYSGSDSGPLGIDEDDFYKYSFRCGRMLESDNRVRFCCSVVVVFVVIFFSFLSYLSRKFIRKKSKNF